jgi:hypothetical protein
VHRHAVADGQHPIFEPAIDGDSQMSRVECWPPVRETTAQLLVWMLTSAPLGPEMLNIRLLVGVAVPIPVLPPGAGSSGAGGGRNGMPQPRRESFAREPIGFRQEIAAGTNETSIELSRTPNFCHRIALWRHPNIR